jgi:hypothetical protein
MMAKWKVEVCRISYANQIITVEADNEEEAKQKALELAGDYFFSAHSADYEVEYVEKEKLEHPL